MTSAQIAGQTTAHLRRARNGKRKELTLNDGHATTDNAKERDWKTNNEGAEQGNQHQKSLTTNDWTQTRVSNAMDTTLKKADKGTTHKTEQEQRRRKRPS